MIFNKNIYRNYWGLLLLFTAILFGCEEDEPIIQPKANFSVSAESTLKQGEEIVFNNESENAVSFLWSFGDGKTFIGKEATHNYELPGTYMVSLEASGGGNRDVFSKEIIIEGLIPATAFTVEDSANLKVALPVSFTNTTTDAISYLWNFGDEDATTSTDENPVFTYEKPGKYTVTLTATGTGGEKAVTQEITINPNNYVLYFLDNDAAKLRKIDLSNPTVAVDLFDLPGFSMGLALDPEAEKLYYSDDDNLIVYSNNLTGTDEQTVSSTFSAPRDIALDVANDYAYVADRSANAILRIDLLSNDTTTLYSDKNNPDFLLPVGIDYHEDYLYITCVEIGAETIWKASTDGSSLTRIIDYDAGGYGYGVEIDKVNNKIYFDDTDGSKILRANLDGSSIETVGTTSDRVYGIAINNETNKYYWAGRDGIIYSANLDGTDQTVVVDLAADVRGLVIQKTD